MTFPIKKRINTKLNCFLLEIQNSEAKCGSETDKRDKEWINKITNLLEEGKTKTAGKVNVGMKTIAAYLEWLTLLGRKDKLMAACLKRLWTWKREK